MLIKRLKGSPEQWLEALQGRNVKAWKNATLMMGGLMPWHPVSPEPFRLALVSMDKNVVFWSITALKRLGKRARYAVPDLAPLTKHSYLGIQQSALTSLATIAPSDAFVKRTIFDAFSNRRPAVRAEAVRAVILLRKLNRQDFDGVRLLLADPNEEVRYYAEITTRNIKHRNGIRQGAD